MGGVEEIGEENEKKPTKLLSLDFCLQWDLQVLS